MAACGNLDDIFPQRLLPGDSAPPIKTARTFPPGAVVPAGFVLPTVIVLWNAGCGGCLPAIRELAAVAARHNALCIAVAVMARDIEKTAAAAATAAASEAIFALEQPSPIPSKMSRGFMTREWLEPSGIPGVPACFVVNNFGNLVWVGDAYAVRSKLPAILQGDHSVETARMEWGRAVTDDDVLALQITLDIIDIAFDGRFEEAQTLMARAEERLPKIQSNAEFSALKHFIGQRLDRTGHQPDHRMLPDGPRRRTE